MNTKIRNWMYRNARPLDIERFKYHFESGSKEEVLNALTAYQNSDGGFGHALEADSWNPNSSPIQTWTATEILLEIDLMDSNHEMIQSIINYLETTDTLVSNRWLNTIETNNDYPGAPWWHFEANDPSNLRYNPSSALAGFILLHAEKTSVVYSVALKIASDSIAFFNTSNEQGEMHEVFCFMRLKTYLELAGLTNLKGYNQYVKKLETSIHSLIESDFSKWAGNYVCKPSQFFNSPSSQYYVLNKEAARYELEDIIKSRDSDGVWSIPWDWGKNELEFNVSKRWWQGYVVVKNLLMLKNFNEEI